MTRRQRPPWRERLRVTPRAAWGLACLIGFAVVGGALEGDWWGLLW